VSGGCLRGRDYLKGRKPFRVTQKMREEVRARVRRALEPREEIALAVLFGSFVKKDFARDVDLAVYLTGATSLHSALEHSEELAKALEGEIGLPFDVVVLNLADEGLLMRALLGGVKVIDRDPLLYHGLRMLALEVRSRFTELRHQGSRGHSPQPQRT